MRHGAARPAGDLEKKNPRPSARRHRGSAGKKSGPAAPTRGDGEALRVSEYEREAIGRQLHDDTCQLLAGLACLTEALAKRATSAPPAETKMQLRELGQELRAGLGRVRAFAHHLVPAPAVGRGLRRALCELVAQARLLFGVKIELRLPSPLLRHRGNHVVHLHGIAHESLANAIKHGGATSIRISLRARGKNHVLEIRDDGCGLSAASERRAGIGRYLMNTRAQMLGARLTVKNGLPRGVRVRVNYTVA